MTTAGFAIGLGNIWRFPYMTGMNGGGAFLFVYILICIFIGIPLFTAEISLGRASQLSPVAGMRKLTRKGSPWVFIGWAGTITAALIFSYYIVIMGWVLAYFQKVTLGEFAGMSPEQVSQSFGAFISDPTSNLIYTFLIVVILGLIVMRGLKEGVEKSCKIMMPMLFAILIFLAVRSLTFPGAAQGLIWYLKPDFSAINGSVILAALGQAFYSIGVGMAGAFAYGSYLHKTESDLPGGAIQVVAFDTLAAFIAGLVIFPALFSFGLEPTAGAGLLFVTMTNLFTKIQAGNLFGGLFFFLVLIAAISSGIGLLEAIVSHLIDSMNISRKKATMGCLAVLFLMSVPVIMSLGPWADVKIFGKDYFSLIDFISGNILLTLGGLAIALYVGYVWKFGKFMEETNMGAGKFRVFRWWKPLINVLIPVAVFFIVLSGLGII